MRYASRILPAKIARISIIARKPGVFGACFVCDVMLLRDFCGRPKTRDPYGGIWKMKPTPHPKPFKSALRPHIAMINKLRGGRWSWPDISKYLAEECGVRVDPSTLRKFYKRTQREKLPLGFEISSEKRAEECPRMPANGRELMPANARECPDLRAIKPPGNPWK